MKTIHARLVLICLSLFFYGQATAGELNVARSPNEVCPILIGSQLPAISVKDLEGKPFDLNMAIAEKPTVLIYFRGGW